MKLHRAVTWYLVMVHLIMGVLGGYLLWPDRRTWILPFGGFIFASLFTAVAIARVTRAKKDPTRGNGGRIGEKHLAHDVLPAGMTDRDDPTTMHNEMIGRLEEGVSQSELDILLRKVIEQSPFGVITTDHEGSVYHANPAASRLLEIPEEELQGRRLVELEVPLASQLFAIPVHGARILGQWGRRRLRCSHSRFLDGSFPRDFFVIEDLTHVLWDIEKQTYDSLIRNLSHEVNNTVGVANSILQSALAYQGQLRPEDQDDLAGAIRIAAERMDSLESFMRRYAEVVRVPAPSKQPAHLLDLLDRVMNRSRPGFNNGRILMNLCVEESPHDPIAMDVVQMEQVFDAVLQNAVEAIEDTGTITVRVGRKGSKTMVCVDDTGSGLADEAREQLWTPFFSTKNDGQGVGLTLARQILVLHGFDFSLESLPDGPTSFQIVFDC